MFVRGSLADTSTPSMSARKKIGIYIHELFASATSPWRKYINANVHVKSYKCVTHVLALTN